jgi:hypothetical protein
MRHSVPFLVLALALSACHPAATPVVAVAAAEAASVAVFGRGGFDMAYSLVSGRDCSIVRLDKGQSYCRHKEAPPPPPEFCTHTLGVPQCFSDPAFLPDHPAGIADGPSRLTPEQARNAQGGWP